MPEFNIKTARLAADFSVLAYKEDSEFVIPDGWSLLREITDKKSDSRAIFLRKGNQVILSFRGTASFKNVIFYF